ncbi:putative gibberellin 20- protein [Phaeoacremonium minimum UCRPA7]|uniref:Putative gibberellin 20-protein n=1 Tax=Phaeoacremonium minimum (strain UCR-PA7) TaxID=1286976 RepID=R8BS63_PHAM7|nr:putative gibberellin 20- protein [Phaeoacremonium minimum UCRPA7]EOO02169.1 putative gibberellin 20- protein [Phaeoacremonium minimum UCRPA7]
MATRLAPAISLRAGSDFENRKEEITRQLVDAAENTGFFTLVDHALSVEEIEAQFAISKSFFALPSEVKRKTKHDPKTALGYENKASRSFALQDGEDGLEVLPGRETHTSKIGGGEFFPIPAKTGPIVVNIGDMLMAWSDDRFKANYHRVRAKTVGFSPDRYSMGYFNMGRENFVFQGPQKKYQYNSQGTKVQEVEEAKLVSVAA